MKLLFIPSWYPSSARPDDGSFFRQWALALSNAGHEVVCLVNIIHSLRSLPGSISSVADKKIAVETEGGLTVYRWETVNLHPGREKSFSRRYGEKSELLLDKILKDTGRPDAAIVHSSIWGGGALSETLKSQKIPFIVFEHLKEFLQTDSFNILQKETIFKAWKNAKHIIAISSAMESAIESMAPEFSNKIIKIPNPVDDSFFVPGNKTSLSEPFRFVTTALLRKEKRIDHLLSAFKLVVDENENCHLTIIGNGPDFKKIKRLVTTAGLKNKVTMMGYGNQDVVKETLQASHCFVLPSSVETFGLAVLEAMSVGLPVIATKCGGPEDLINTTTGIMIPVSNDTTLLSGAMLTMIKSLENYQSNEIRSFIIKNYGIKKYVQRCEKALS